MADSVCWEGDNPDDPFLHRIVNRAIRKTASLLVIVVVILIILWVELGPIHLGISSSFVVGFPEHISCLICR